MLGIMVCIPANSQLVKELDQVSPFCEGLAAIKKGDQWAFINKQGTIVINFRNDLVPTGQKGSNVKAPVFQNGRALISHVEDNITYYGYIDKNGNNVITGPYVNATKFENGFAIVMHFSKKVVGKNKLLDKDVVAYHLEEYVIDVNGKAMTPMLHTRNCVPDKLKSGKSIDITTVLLGERMVGVQTAEKKWEIHSF